MRFLRDEGPRRIVERRFPEPVERYDVRDVPATVAKGG